ncbi:ribbon-helix-helix domain-containing protein [Novosphingobium sp. PASSN1]|uniref:ribbon-helix-helix domain-containing protein n=1 Tax=Novosphingobium sp. PASSN1 TaxID=2015561 RepID=UPI000BC624A8|nr:ribbon-helix-helix domain-containing protein [Novosphingobium sp. PASSN1]OYU34313.1 MAG: hypothetical protein CFE35_15095 [Novosphingobium sp. PASSN1]
MSRFANLADKPKAGPNQEAMASEKDSTGFPDYATAAAMKPSQRPASRIGRKAIAAYFTPEMSLAMHLCARKNCVTLQELMAEAFNDVLRKYGESPIGE